jgi:molybdopterin synthase catalytic subunit
VLRPGICSLAFTVLIFYAAWRIRLVSMTDTTTPNPETTTMNIDKLIERIKHHPDYHRVGMILAHNGVVRGTSRDGRPVRGLRVSVDREKLATVIDTHKSRPGILEILVEIAAERDLSVGDDVMLLVVAGDIRENVIATLHDTLDAIKSTVTHKTEYFT